MSNLLLIEHDQFDADEAILRTVPEFDASNGFTQMTVPHRLGCGYAVLDREWL